MKTPWSTLPICQGPAMHAAAVDHRRDALAGPVLLDQELGGELGRAVQGPVPDHRELLGDTRRRDAGNLLVVGELEAGLASSTRARASCGSTG